MDRVNHNSYEQQAKLWIVRDLERDGHIVLPTLIGQVLSLSTTWSCSKIYVKKLFGATLTGDPKAPWPDEQAVDYYGANGMVSWINNYDPLSYVIPGRDYNGLLQW